MVLAFADSIPRRSVGAFPCPPRRRAPQPKTVYLAGPISGLTYGQARHGWREAMGELLPDHIHPASPMRAKDFLIDAGVLRGSPDAYHDHIMATSKGITTRDRNDVKTCDAMIACFLGVDRVSIGTCIEFGWADAFRKPIICIMEPVNVHQHVMIAEMAGYIVETLEEAAALATALLTPEI